MFSMCRATVACVVFRRLAAVSRRPLRCNSRKKRRSFQSNTAPVLGRGKGRALLEN
ncbi:hypothetical protein D3C85_1934870 [compost metagenome]